MGAWAAVLAVEGERFVGGAYLEEAGGGGAGSMSTSKPGPLGGWLRSRCGAVPRAVWTQ